MSQTGISEKHFLQPHHFMAYEEIRMTLTAFLNLRLLIPLHEITGNIALHYKNVIDITSKSNSLTLFIFLNSISYCRKLSN